MAHPTMDVAELEAQLQELQDYVSDTELTLPDEVDVPKDFSHVAVVDGLPSVGQDKLGKLMPVVLRLCSQIEPITESALHMPFNPSTNKTDGFAFVQYSSANAVQAAVRALHNFRLDKNHTLFVTPYSELSRVEAVPDKVEVPELDRFPPMVALRARASENLYSWLGDPMAREQVAIRFADHTEVSWVEPNDEPQTDYAGEREASTGKVWCDRLVAWSTFGTYLATFHPQGIALWGSGRWKKLSRFAHPGVEEVQFSPREGFMVTWNGQVNQDDAVILWDSKTSMKLRGFPCQPPPGTYPWPYFKWSHDDKFFAHITPSGIALFDTQNRSRTVVKVNGVKDFSFSPKDNTMVYWVPDVGNSPASIALVSVPDGRVLRKKNLYSVKRCDIYWHNRADFVCVRATRLAKNKKTEFTSVELFRVRDRDVPVESFEIRENVEAVAWEPDGVRLAIIHSESMTRFNVTLYTMGKAVGGEKCDVLYTLENKQANRLYWSPSGNFLLLAGIDSPFNGPIEWVDVDERKSLHSAEHYMCNHVAWDPTGRYVITAVLQPMTEGASVRYQMEAGYRLWTFQGQLVHSFQKANFFQVTFRPHPPSPLSAEERRVVVKRLPKLAGKFKEMDRRVEMLRQAERMSERRRLWSEWNEYLARRMKDAEAERAERAAVLGEDEFEQADVEHAEVEEEIVLESIEEELDE